MRNVVRVWLMVVGALVVLASVATAALAQLDNASSVWSGEWLMQPSSDAMTSSGRGPPLPTFDLNIAQNGSGPSQLPSTLTVNGTVMTPVLDCDARNISGTNWTCATGGVFTENGAGASPTSGLAAPFTETGARAMTNTAGAKNHIAPNSSVGNVTTEDLVFEVLGRFPTAGYSLAGSYSGAASGGWELVWATSIGLNMVLQVASSTSCTASSGTIGAAGVWGHMLFFVDRSGSTRIYRDGAFINTTSVAACDGLSIASSNTMLLKGRAGTAGQTGDDQLSVLHMWKCSACLNTTAEMDAIAAERTARVMGVYPLVAAGQAYPTAMTRATTATVDIDRDDDGVRRVFTVGNGWMRTARRKEVSTSTRYSGFLSEPQATNLALQSQVFGTTWTQLTVADGRNDNNMTAPDGTATGDSEEAAVDAVGLEHGFTQAVTVTAVPYTFSAWFKAGQQTFAFLRDATIANGVAWVNLSTCVVGTKQAGITTSVAESYGSGLCRFSVTFTGTAAAHTFSIGGASADNVLTYTEGADATSDWSVWGAQLEAQPIPTSYIATTTASVTRNGDVLTYTTTGNWPGSGTVVTETLLPNFDPTGAGADAFTYLYLSGSVYAGTEGIAAGDAVGCDVKDTTQQASITGGGDVYDGNKHETRCALFTNDFQGWYDSTSIGTDVSGTTAPTVTSIQVGHWNSTIQPRGLITRQRLFPMRVSP